MTHTIKVWDAFVRVFHWLLVAGFALDYSYLEGGTDYFGQYKLHDWLGYFLCGWVGARIVWGFVGSHYARFTQFVPTPARFFAHLHDILRGRERRYLGHNPAAGAMIVTLLTGVLALGVTGWMQSLDRFFGVQWVQEIHMWIANTMVTLVAIHVVAALWASWRHRENLVMAMVTGRKAAEAPLEDPKGATNVQAPAESAGARLHD